MGNEIYILEAIAYHWAKDEHMVILEQRQWLGYGDIGKSKLEEIMKQISHVWRDVYVRDRMDTQVTLHLYSTVQSNGIILKDDVCKYEIICNDEKKIRKDN